MYGIIYVVSLSPKNSRSDRLQIKRITGNYCTIMYLDPRHTQHASTRRTQKQVHVQNFWISIGTHTKGLMDGMWVAPTAENLYRQMMEMKEKPIEEGEKLMTEEEICEAVLGHKSGYVRGLGPGPKPTTTSSFTSFRGPTEEDFNSMKAQIEALKQMILEPSYGRMRLSSSSW